MKDLNSNNNEVECMSCGHTFIMNFIFEAEVCTKIEPEICPKCGWNIFKGKFQTDPNAWFGVFGTNG